MKSNSVPPRTGLPRILGVPLFALTDERGRRTRLGAVDEDPSKIGMIADHLTRVGYGVDRVANRRDGRLVHRLSACWRGPGDPPEFLNPG